MADFSKLNGYAVKDAVARQQISELSTAVSGKVNIADIVDNLTSDAANKPLSAKQGKALSARISNINDTAVSNAEAIEEINDGMTEVNRKLAELEDSAYILVTKETPYSEIADAMDAFEVGTALFFHDTGHFYPALGRSTNGFRFLDQSTAEFIEITLEDGVNKVTRVPIDKPLNVTYANEELTIGE